MLFRSKFGDFANNYVLMHVANYCPNLERLIVGSDSIDDDGLALVLKKATELVHLDISHSNTINGHCFEEIVSTKLRRLIISFDEYRCRCTQQVLILKGLAGQITLINRTKRK